MARGSEALRGQRLRNGTVHRVYRVGAVVSDWTAVRALAAARASQALVMPGPDGAWG